MSDTVRIGFIGAGGISAWHVDRLRACGQNAIVALADPSQASLAALKEKRPELADVPTFADYRQMLAEVEMDAVEIHSPHCFHPEQALAALDAGRHVLVEKPLAASVEDARRLIAKRDEVGKVLMVSYQRHYSPVYQYMREQALSGELGELQNVILALTQEWRRNARGTWRQALALSCGGQLNDSGSHVLDMMLWCTGLRPAEVYAQVNRFDLEVEVDSAVTVRFSNGAIGNVTVLGSTPGYWEMFGVWGEKGGVSYDITSGLQRQLYGGQPEHLELPPATSDPDANFVRAILGLEEVLVPAECGLAVAELTQAAYRSAAEGKPVQLLAPDAPTGA